MDETRVIKVWTNKADFEMEFPAFLTLEFNFDEQPVFYETNSGPNKKRKSLVLPNGKKLILTETSNPDSFEAIIEIEK